MQNISFPALIILMLTMKDARLLAMTLVSMEITLQMMPVVIVAAERSVPILKVGKIFTVTLVLGTS